MQRIRMGGTYFNVIGQDRDPRDVIDLDLAIIEDAYQAEYVARQQRSERLVATGQFAVGVAHELRNPLNVVKTSVYYLLNAKNLTPEKQAEHLNRIEQHVTVADGIITALSRFAKLTMPNLQPFPIEQCVREALETNAVGGNVQVTIDGPSSLPHVLADIDQVRIVFANLIRNARDAMPHGGLLSITCRAVDDAVEVAAQRGRPTCQPGEDHGTAKAGAGEGALRVNAPLACASCSEHDRDSSPRS